VLNDRLDPIPLFITSQATFAQHDQSWMRFDLEQRNEVSRIGGDNCKIVIQRVLPDLAIRAPRQTDVRHRLSVHTHAVKSADQCRRDILVQQ